MSNHLLVILLYYCQFESLSDAEATEARQCVAADQKKGVLGRALPGLQGAGSENLAEKGVLGRHPRWSVGVILPIH